MAEIRPTFARERALLRAGSRHVAGVDEAGRGPLAGPVVAAAVILNPRDLPKSARDSKCLERAAREACFEEIVARAIAIAVSSASCAEIDRFNIRGATLIAMRRALAGLAVAPCAALIDGRDAPPGLDLPMQPVIDGDALVLSIAAASIVAKVTRDRLMERLDSACPGYGFARHVGYSTPMHKRALGALGPSRYHRASFAPVRLSVATRAEVVIAAETVEIVAEISAAAE